MSENNTRNHAFDVLKLWMTVLVIFHHSAITYGATGGWFYKEVAANNSFSTKLLIYFCTINQAYFMGLFFLIAGYFTLPSLEEKGILPFIKDRLIRLGIPILFFGFILGSITIALARSAKDKPFLESLLILFKNGMFEIGPLWFAEALLIFSAITLLFKRFIPSLKALPSDKTLIISAILCGIVAFIVRLPYPVGKEFILLQLGYFPMYIALFTFGLCASKQKILEKITFQTARKWKRIALFTLPLIIPLGFIKLEGDAIGGWSIPALVYALWEPFVAFGIILWLLYFANQKYSSFQNTYARSAFGVYIIHPIILVGVAVLWRDVQAPALIKFIVTGGISTLLCFIIMTIIFKIKVIISV